MSRMYGGKDTLYEVLGVNRSSSAREIAKAYQELRTELEERSPDPRRFSLVAEAYEVLSDPQRRAAYDASLRGGEFLRPRGKSAPDTAKKWIVVGVGAALAAVVLYAVLRPRKDDAQRIPQEIVAAASPAVGRVHSLDISGRATPLGHAFAIEQGVMLTTCQGIRANAQLVVRFGARTVPAQLVKSDPQRNFCRLAVIGAGSWPLGVSAAEPRVGDTVYAATTNESGEIALREGKITGVLPHAKGKALELSFEVPPASSGGPVLDTYGKVAGMMASSHGFGTGKNVALPAAWVRDELRRN